MINILLLLCELKLKLCVLKLLTQKIINYYHHKK